MKKHNLKKRFLAVVLSAVTIVSVSAVSMSTTAMTVNAALITDSSSVSSDLAGSIAKNALGFVGKSLLNTTTTRLINMGLDPLFGLIFGGNDGPSNQDIIDEIDKKIEEVEKKIDNVIAVIEDLSEETSKYHLEEMKTLQAITSNIDTMEFRKQADKIYKDYANVLKRIKQNKDNFTCDGTGVLNSTTYKAYKAIIDDPVCNISNLQADFDDMLSFFKGEYNSNNHQNGYQQLTSYLLDRIIASDKNEHSFTNTPDYIGVINGINTEIGTMEEHAILDFMLINTLNNMAYKVKEYEIANNIITVNSDEKPYTKYLNVADEMLEGLNAMNEIYTNVIEENKKMIPAYAPVSLYVTKIDGTVVTKGCKNFIDAWSQGCDSGLDFKIDCRGDSNGTAAVADAVKGYKLDENVKGINSNGGFQVPWHTNVELLMGYNVSDTRTFDSSEKSNLNTFQLSSYSSLKIKGARIKGGNNAVLVPENTTDVKVTVDRCRIDSVKDPILYVCGTAKNVNMYYIFEYSRDCGAPFIDKSHHCNVTFALADQDEEPHEPTGEERWGT